MAIELSPKWKDLFLTDNRYTLCIGGRGSSKSFSVSYWALLKTFEPNERILFTRKTMTSAHISIIPQVKEVMEIAGIEEAFTITSTTITNKYTGSEIIFKGLTTSSGENTAFMKSLTGITTVIIDEFEEMNDREELFDKLDLSVRTKAKKNRIVMIMNPDLKDTWIYNRFFIQAHENDCQVIHTTFLDNADNLEESFLRNAERMKKVAPHRFEHVFLGAWRDKAEGTIFTNWIVGDYPDKVKSVFGLDDGFTDPCALVETYIDRKNQTIYLKEHLYHSELIEEEKINHVAKATGSNLIIADSAAPSVIEHARRRNLNIRRINKKVVTLNDSIKELQSYRLVVDPNSYNLIRELNNYVWHDSKSETPKDAWNHLLDAVRYATGDQLLKKKQHTGLRLGGYGF